MVRIALFSHDAVGLGHVRRNLAIAHALSDALPRLTGEPVAGLLITGQPAATGFETPAGWDWLVVPGLAKGGDGYEPRHLRVGMDGITAIRGNVVRVALREFAPDLVVVDRHAFGVHRELERALVELRATNPSTALVLGLREVLDRPKVARAEWQAIGGADAVARLFDAVWVYGDPTVHDATETGEIPPQLAPLVTHTGYLANGRPMRPDDSGSEPFLLTTVGGGSDGAAVAEAAVRATVPAGHRHLVVTGPQMPDADRDRIRALAAPGTEVVSHVPDAYALMRRAAAVVCMGGYNTVSEVMTTDVPALVVPRVGARKEQPIRARRLARRGLVETLRPADLTPDALGDWFARVAGTVVRRDGVDLDGLDRLGALAARLIDDRRARRRDREVYSDAI